MKTTQVTPPTQAEKRILFLIEQMMEVVPKGTALGLGCVSLFSYTFAVFS